MIGGQEGIYLHKYISLTFVFFRHIAYMYYPSKRMSGGWNLLGQGGQRLRPICTQSSWESKVVVRRQKVVDKKPVEIDAPAVAKYVQKGRSLCTIFPPHPVFCVGVLVSAVERLTNSCIWSKYCDLIHRYVLAANVSIFYPQIFAHDSPVWICYRQEVEVVEVHQVSEICYTHLFVQLDIEIDLTCVCPQRPVSYSYVYWFS